jgi:hypothetical protein
MRHLLIALSSLLVAPLATAAPVTAEIVSVNKIWDDAPHSAFTDLIRWKDQFVCAFREGRKHVSTDGRIRVLLSGDGETWESAAVVTLEGFDLRDAGLSIAPDGRLMLIGGAAPRKRDSDGAPTGTFVSFSDDGRNWAAPKVVVDPGRWLWRVTWRDGKAYGVAYASFRPLKDNDFTQLLASDDGLRFTLLVPKLLGEGTPTEATVRFAEDGTAYILQRRDAASRRPTVSADGTPKWPSAYFGASKPPYRDWKWHDLGEHVGGPNFVRLPSGQWIAAGRMFNAETPKTKLAVLDVDTPAIEPILELPSGGDNSYPGLVWHDDALWVSYYSSHEGKSSIYLAQVRVQ